MRSEPVVVVFFFLALFLLLTSVELWITSRIVLPDTSVAWLCDRIEQEAEAVRVQGQCEARRRDFPCLLFAWSTVKDRTLSWTRVRIVQEGSGGHKTLYGGMVA
jgi:hypothetical protein